MKPEMVIIGELCSLVEALLTAVSGYEEIIEKLGVKGLLKIDRQSALEVVEFVRVYIEIKQNEQGK